MPEATSQTFTSPGVPLAPLPVRTERHSRRPAQREEFLARLDLPELEHLVGRAERGQPRAVRAERDSLEGSPVLEAAIAQNSHEAERRLLRIAAACVGQLN